MTRWTLIRAITVKNLNSRPIDILLMYNVAGHSKIAQLGQERDSCADRLQKGYFCRFCDREIGTESKRAGLIEAFIVGRFDKRREILCAITS